jgi:hypothetical protein
LARLKLAAPLLCQPSSLFSHLGTPTAVILSVGGA